MSNTAINVSTPSLTFQSTRFNVIDCQGQLWLRSSELASALGYEDERAVTRIYSRNEEEFTNKMSGVVNLTPSGNLVTKVRIFSLRGAHLVAMFSRTEVAKEFRKWVLDVLDKEIERMAYGVAGPLTEEMQESLKRLVQTGAKRLPFEKQTSAIFQQWNELSDHFGVSYKDIPAERYPEVISLVTRLQSEWELVDEPVPAVIPRHEDSHYRNIMALCSMAMLSFERWPLISGALYRLNRDLAAKIASPITEGDILARMVLKQFREEIESAQSEELPCNQRREAPAMRFLAEMR